jgi:uncharacterized protein (DUF305 family)
MTKSNKPKVREHNTQTNEIIDREMDDIEFAQYEIDQEAHAIKLAEIAAKQTAKQTILNRLGLTAEEAAILLS